MPVRSAIFRKMELKRFAHVGSLVGLLIFLSVFVKGTDSLHRCQQGTLKFDANGAEKNFDLASADCTGSTSCHRVLSKGIEKKGEEYEITYDCGPCDGGLAGCRTCTGNECNAEIFFKEEDDDDEEYKERERTDSLLHCIGGSMALDEKGVITTNNLYYDKDCNKYAPTRSCNRYITTGIEEKGEAYTISYGCGPCDGGLAGCRTCTGSDCNADLVYKKKKYDKEDRDEEY